MSLDDSLGDIETQPCAELAPWPAFPIAIEHMRDVIGEAMPETRVGDCDPQFIAATLRANSNVAPFGRELDRVPEQVREHPKDPLGVGFQPR